MGHKSIGLKGSEKKKKGQKETTIACWESGIFLRGGDGDLEVVRVPKKVRDIQEKIVMGDP